MAYIGNKPTAVPLTSGDITNGIITTAKIADDAISAAKLASGVGGKVLQVSNFVQTSSAQNISSSSYTDLTAMSVAITPTASNSKILISASINARTVDQLGFGMQFVRGSTSVYATLATYSIYTSGITEIYSAYPFSYIDSPNTTSETTYKIQVRTHNGNEVNFNAGINSNIYLMEIGA